METGRQLMSSARHLSSGNPSKRWGAEIREAQREQRGIGIRRWFRGEDEERSTIHTAFVFLHRNTGSDRRPVSTAPILYFLPWQLQDKVWKWLTWSSSVPIEIKVAED
jgi:hypothetical protein